MRRLAVLAALSIVPLAAGAAFPSSLWRKPLRLTGRVIRPGEFRSFATTEPVVLRSPGQWVRRDPDLTDDEVAARTARLEREGFAAVVSEDLVPTRSGRGLAALSYAVQLRTAAAARSELAASLREAAAVSNAGGAAYTAFPVHGIPRARGYHVAGPEGSGDSVVFADGRFVYFVGVGWDEASGNGVLRMRLTSAALRLYKRVRGR